LAKDLAGYAWGALEGHTVQDLLHPVLFVPRTTKCDQLFREFQRKRTHVALVVDEYGRLAGLVTMEDLLEELFGEIADEKETRS
jgi:CBS domain containing-hemolysin-like protein